MSTMVEEKKEVVDNQIISNDKKKISTVNQSQSQNKTKQKMHYSGFWVRGAALLIDSFVIMIITIVIGLPIGIVLSLLGVVLGPFGFIMQFLVSILGLLIAWAYFIFMTYKFQATLGKMAVGAEVLGEDDKKLSFGDVVLRETVGKFVSSFLFSIGYIMTAFTSKKQGLHDFIARSVVIYKDPVKGSNTAVVVVTYILYSIFIFFFIVLITSIIALSSFLLFNEAANSNKFNAEEVIWNNGLEEIMGDMPIDEMGLDIGDDEINFIELQDMLGEDGLQIDMSDVDFEDIF